MTPEQQARDMLKRMDVVELANLIAERDRLRAQLKEATTHAHKAHAVAPLTEADVRRIFREEPIYDGYHHF